MSHPTDTPLPSKQEESAPESIPATFGPYTDLHFLGQGGMARVYRAYDPKLRRWVALKFIRGDNPELAERLLLEARTQARIDHPHVCKVFEAGEIEGKPYIAMQFIEGAPIKDCDLSLEQKVHLLKQVAEAVHAAHRAGLIHRDLKPANIMVEREETGEWIPYVLDFGLAREQEAPGITRSGLIIGSPWYMSPEQARGESDRVDRRSDVYSLGVTLYELLSGKLPFEAESAAEVLVRVLSEEAARPLRDRDPHFPEDLDIIVLKCVEKEPAARYESARALAEDLHRFLEGEPIQARRAGLWYRLSKRARRHKALVTMALFALLSSLVLGGLAWRAQRIGQRQAVLAQQFGQQMKEIEAILRFACMLPLHDIRPEQQLIRQKMLSIENALRDIGEAGVGPGNYALGRGHLALHEYESAQRNLELAWKSGYHQPQVAYALGLALGRLYQKNLEDVDTIRNKDLHELQRRKIETRFRDPALQYLRQSKDLSTESADYAEALIAFYEKRFGIALEKAQKSTVGIPWFYEAWKLQGDIHSALARKPGEEGAYADAMREYKLAEEAYNTAQDKARSDPEIYSARCRMWNQVMIMKYYGEGGDLTADKDSAVGACSDGARADPEREDFDLLLSGSYRLWSESLISQGKDPQPSLALASEYARRAVGLRPDHASAHRSLGTALQVLASYKMNHGLDPLADMDAAIESYRKAVALDPADSMARNQLGNASYIRGEWQSARGKDPRESYDAAILSYREAIALNPAFIGAYTNLGNACTRKADYELQLGINPEASLKLAVEFLEKAVSLNPKYPFALNVLGLAYYNRGLHQHYHGRDPLPDWNKALEYYDRTLQLNPGYAFAYVNKVLLYQKKSEYEWLHDLDFRKSVTAGKDAFEAGLRLNADIGSAYVYRGWLHLTEAEAELCNSRSPAVPLGKAREFLNKGAALDPTDGEPRPLLADAWLIEAQWDALRDQDPETALRSAEEETAAAIRLGLSGIRADLLLLSIQCVRAQWLQRGGRNAAAVIERGLQHAQQALSLDKTNADAAINEGILLLLRARMEKDAKQKEELRQQAGLLIRQALLSNPALEKRYRTSLCSLRLCGESS